MKRYSIFFDNHLDRNHSDKLRDEWLRELENSSDFTKATEPHKGKQRTVLRAKIESGDIAITHHEWGVEYIFTFATGVATGLIANLIHDYLKVHTKKYSQTLADIESTEYQEHHETEVRVDLNTHNGPVTIAVIKKEKVEIKLTKAKLKKIFDKDELFQ